MEERSLQKLPKASYCHRRATQSIGFDNLRDYLNDQQGLTGVANHPPQAAANKAAAPRGPYRGTQDEGDAGEEAAPEAQEASHGPEPVEMREGKQILAMLQPVNLTSTCKRRPRRARRRES
jgi:hypothetical protein